MEIGQRVKLVAPSPLLTLRSPFGVVVREDTWGGYMIVRLDEPAIYHGLHNWEEELAEVVEHPNNMEPTP